MGAWRGTSGWGRVGAAAVLAIAFGLAGCDNKRIAELEEGVATETDVRAKFGTPDAIYPEAGGAKTLEYARQPEGQRNYMITIGADGKMSALRQVLRPEVFAKVERGMDRAHVRRLLGKPAKTQFYALKNEETWDWRFIDAGASKVFTVTFDAGGLVASTGSAPDTGDGQSGLR